MKITDIRTTVISLPRRRDHKWATSKTGIGHGYVIVEIDTDEGITGLGEAPCLAEWGGDHMRYHGETAGTTLHVIHDWLSPALVGKDPFDIEELHRLMHQVIKGFPFTKASLDFAMHDIKGKALGVPVYQLLGGLVRREIPIANSLGIMDIDAGIDEALQAIDEGIKTIKCKIGLDHKRDIELIRKLREAIGADIDIVVDANQGYPTPKFALMVAHEFEKYGVAYFEQPVEGIRGMAEVTRGTTIPIMADETAWTSQDVLEIIEQKAADKISLYTTKPGGLLPTKKVAAVVEAAGMTSNVNGSLESGVGNAANLHLIASTPVISDVNVLTVTSLEDNRPTNIAGRFYLDDIVTEPFQYEDGYLIVPDKPGLGVEIDREKLAKYTIK
jgi:muconate cycloisomerase